MTLYELLRTVQELDVGAHYLENWQNLAYA